MQQEHSHLGSGWRFPTAIDETGGIAVSSLEAKVEQSIRIILSTARGERAMNDATLAQCPGV